MGRWLAIGTVTLAVAMGSAGCGSSSHHSATTTTPSSPTTAVSSKSGPTTTAPSSEAQLLEWQAKQRGLFANLQLGLAGATKAIDGSSPTATSKACSAALFGLQVAHTAPPPPYPAAALLWTAALHLLGTTMHQCVADSTGANPHAYQSSQTRRQLDLGIYGLRIRLHDISRLRAPT